MKRFDLRKYEKLSLVEKWTMSLGATGLFHALEHKRMKQIATISSEFLRNMMSIGFEKNKK